MDTVDLTPPVNNDSGEVISKEFIKIPKGIRYIGEDWGSEERYNLENYPYPHILNKVLTGCGYTEYCIRNDQNLILCSPRKMLLENKMEQHPESNVYYAKNELEKIVDYERSFTLADSKKAASKYYSTIGSVFVKPKTPTPEEIEEKKKRIVEFKEKVKEHYYNCGGKLGKGIKILVTYDSFRHVKEALQEIGVLNDFQVVVDEFQSILVDVKFKPNTEMELLNQLVGIQRVCYVSATPMLDKYLKRLDEFKDLPYFEFDWVTEEPLRIIRPNLSLHKFSKSIFSEIIKVVYSYKDGKFEKESKINDQGLIEEIESKEAVLYVNSVTTICSIITKCELLPEECNILVAKTQDNETKLRKAFNSVFKKLGLKRKRFGSKDVLIGTVPTKGQPHKMFTLCTRTVYLGADFYSTCARTFIFSDANIDCLCVDISMDLPQILGRQRLNENPWKNSAELFIKTSLASLTRKDFEELLSDKTSATINLLNIFSKIFSDEKERHSLAKKYEEAVVSNNYKNDYVAVNRHAGSDLVPVFNKLMLVAEERAFDIQQVDYKDRVSIFNALFKKGYSTVNVDSEITTFNNRVTYAEKMEYTCILGSGFLTDEEFNLFLNSIPKSFKNYYTVLGPAKCKAHKYQKGEMEKEYQRLLNNQGVSLEDRIYDTFHAGDRLKRTDIKTMLEKIYQDSGFQATAKAVDLKKWFNLKEIQFRVKGTNIREAGFELISRITPPTP